MKTLSSSLDCEEEKFEEGRPKPEVPERTRDSG
jgi:hypothetical protein